MALRIRKVLPSLIHSDQTAYVKDRCIGESVRLINDVLEFTDHEKIEAVPFSAGFRKVFNSVDHSFLFSALKCFGFGDDFIQLVRTLVNNAESCVMNHGPLKGYPDKAILFLLISLFLRW